MLEAEELEKYIAEIDKEREEEAEKKKQQKPSAQKWWYPLLCYKVLYIFLSLILLL